MLAADVQQFYCFEVLSEMLDWFGRLSQHCLLTISCTLMMDNITKYNKFCAKEEASSVNEKSVAQRSYKKAQRDEFRPRP